MTALRRGDYEPIDAPDGCFAYLRTLGEERVLAALNFTSDELELLLPAASSMVASTRPERDAEILKRTIRLHGNEGCLLMLAGDGR